MNWSLAELRRRLAANPDLSLEQPCELTSKPTSAETVNGSSVTLSATQDDAQTLYDYIRILEPTLFHLFVRDMPFETFRIDIAVPVLMIAIEVDGGQFKPGGGKHGSRRDYQKTRRLVAAGWWLYRFTAGEVRDNPLGVIAEIREALLR